MSDDIPYPNWSAPATKGEVMFAIAHMRSITTKLAGALVAMETGNAEKLKAALDGYFTEDDELAAFSEKLGGSGDAK